MSFQRLYQLPPDINRDNITHLKKMEGKMKENLYIINANISGQSKKRSNSKRKLLSTMGTLLRLFPKLYECPDPLKRCFDEGQKIFTQTGRKFNIDSDDPREWISTHDGKPRW